MCRFVASDQPRAVSGRHAEECADRFGDDPNGCQGCLPCSEPHCRVCRRTHAEGTCAECLAEARDNLHQIARMCDALPEEVEHRGIEGEAMVLLAPATNPERRGHLEASVLAGRIPWEAIETSHKRDCDNPRCTGCVGELHPEFVLGTWESAWRDALEHDEPAEAFDLSLTVDYIDRTMGYMADYEWAPFEDFAGDLRRCMGHLEVVLHDGEQVDTGAPCLGCQVPLQREWGRLAAADGWRCPRCREWRSDVDYRLNVAQLHNAKADWLTDRDMETRTGIKAGTVRSWSREKNDGHTPITKRIDSGRTLYSVAQVRERASQKGMLKGGAA